ncbi:protein of unknown function [Candidatus Promineifilum breve]|uniref:Uncharacterized protein n=1 Tax=Candidatus Promineifilum breve TaxID=1806508 RepID=A0A160T469_9CHLR|nr:hypothetical protein [Candidatus Promineifilum breve]CUS05071.2 protein of unknown function [Candidatus Promineifilum breve]
MDTFSGQFWLGLVVNILSSFLGVVVAYLMGKLYFDRCYANWHVRLIQNQEEKLDRPISPRKAREICDEPADLSVFLKGIASPYGFFTCDIIQDGEASGLLNVEEVRKDFRLFKRNIIRRYIRRIYTIDMDKNPKPADRSTIHPAL